MLSYLYGNTMHNLVFHKNGAKVRDTKGARYILGTKGFNDIFSNGSPLLWIWYKPFLFSNFCFSLMSQVKQPKEKSCFYPNGLKALTSSFWPSNGHLLSLQDNEELLHICINLIPLPLTTKITPNHVVLH